MTILEHLRGFSFARIKSDLSAGATTALVAIPDGIASAILAGLNPVHGLYALMIGTPIAAALASSQFMYVANTGALAIGTGGALESYTGDAKVQALIVLVLLAGLIQLAMGLLKLGGLVRFVANAVLIGFMTGVAVRIILSQLGELNGYHAEGSNALLRTFDWLMHLHHSDPWSTAVGLGTLGLIFFVERTRLSQLAMAIALLAATLVVWLLGVESVGTLKDVSIIPDGLPPLVVPQWELIGALLPAAAGLAIIALVQGVGVSKTIPNPDGTYPDISRDFSAKGVANLASGVFSGMPVGGTMSETAVSLKAGARSRWAAIFSGLFIVIGVLLFADLLGHIAMPAIAALLIVAGIEAIKPDRIGDVWHSGWEPRVILLTTFFATLVLSVHEAVFLGVGLSMLHFIYVSSVDVRVVALRFEKDGGILESPVPPRVGKDESVALMVYGNLYFAAAATLESRLPDAEAGARVILRMRGLSRAGSTLITVLEVYARKLQRKGAQLVLADVSPGLYSQLEKTGTTNVCGEGNLYSELPDLFASTRQALHLPQTTV